MLKTFSIQTLGCRVNQYESDQLAALLRARGLTQVDKGGDLRVVNTCSVTVQAASKSRQTVRRAVKLPVLNSVEGGECGVGSQESSFRLPTPHSPLPAHSRILVTGCWATSNPTDASELPGVDAVLGHHDDIALELDRLLSLWKDQSRPLSQAITTSNASHLPAPASESYWDDGSMIQAGIPGPLLAVNNKPRSLTRVKKKLRENIVGTRSLPLLGERQTHHQRAYLKIQDGCDAHCTYCIIPQLRPSLWSKPVHDCVEEAKALVDAGHREVVLTGIFLGAYGQPTALRRRQTIKTARPLADLVTALCTQVPDLHRLRFSSLEPGDLTDDLIERLRDHEQVVPHFHLPLQSGSDAILRRMNRQYSREDFLRMIDKVHDAFDRPAITTDIIVGFPGEDDEQFAQTLDVVDRVRFIHTHAFSFSPRPGTAAARWEDDFVRGPVVNERIEMLNDRAREHSLEFRQEFVGDVVEVLVERQGTDVDVRHGRSERYFDVHFDCSMEDVETGDAVNLRITRVTPQRTWGEVLR